MFIADILSGTIESPDKLLKVIFNVKLYYGILYDELMSQIRKYLMKRLIKDYIDTSSRPYLV